MENFSEIFKNKFLISAFLGWATAQIIKVFCGVLKERKFDFKWLIETGGMPSAHSAGVAALATSVGLNAGFKSPLFGLACVFALVVMFDAQTMRRSVGEQAEILNKILEDLYQGKKIADNKIREFLGHTPLEVIAGAFLGVLIGIIIGG